MPCTTADRLADAYRRYLAGERGLAAGTVRLRERVARLFLSGLSEPVEEHLSRLDGAQVAAFVLRECPGRSVSAARTVVSGTRSLLRFLYLEGYLPRRLDAGVPGMAGWSMTALPRAVDPQLAARLIASCDPDTAAGVATGPSWSCWPGSDARPRWPDRRRRSGELPAAGRPLAAARSCSTRPSRALPRPGAGAGIPPGRGTAAASGSRSPPCAPRRRCAPGTPAARRQPPARRRGGIGAPRPARTAR